MASQSGLFEVKNRLSKTEAKAEVALAALLASTRRQQRKLSLVQIAKYLKVAMAYYGGLPEVAGLIGLSDKMLRQFLAIDKISPEVRHLFSTRKIDSVDIAVHLSSFPAKDQMRIAKGIVSKKASSNDVRDIKYLKESSPKSDVRNLVDKVIASKNIREYLVIYKSPSMHIGKEVYKKIRKSTGKGNSRLVLASVPNFKIAITADGKERLEKLARTNGMTKREFLHQLTGA